MSVFKEETYVIDSFGKRQKQIYVDSADFGIFLEDNEVSALREAVQEIRKYCHTAPVEHTEGLTGKGTRTDFFVAWDQEGDMVRGSHYTIQTWTPKIKGVFVKAKTLFTITCQNKLMTKNSFDRIKVLDKDFIHGHSIYGSK